MPLSTTIPSIDCVPICDTTQFLDDPEFYSLLIDRLVTETGVSLASITQQQIATATIAAQCTLQDRVVFPAASPEKLKSIIIYLSSLL